MSRQAVVLVAILFVLAITFQFSSASFDLGKYLDEHVRDTIKENNITCDNYEEYCRKSTEQFQNANKHVDEMTETLCRLYLKVYVCETEVTEEEIQGLN
ncbi:hypothetical protein TKK_0011149 [Trichogramma kaykai]